MTCAGQHPLLCMGGTHSPRHGFRHFPCGRNMVSASTGDSAPDPKRPQGDTPWPFTNTNVSSMAGSKCCDPWPQRRQPCAAQAVALRRDGCRRRPGLSRSAMVAGLQPSTTRRRAAPSRMSSARCLWQATCAPRAWPRSLRRAAACPDHERRPYRHKRLPQSWTTLNLDRSTHDSRKDLTCPRTYSRWTTARSSRTRSW